MARCPDYYTNISLMLSRVMGDVGVNEECVLKRRRSNLIVENMYTLTDMTLHKGMKHIFGSQTEGTTTVDLNSDTDILCSLEDTNVIQDWKDWQHGKTNLLMLRDEQLYPGYCKLQLLYDDVPLPVSRDDCPGGGCWVVDNDGKVILRGWYVDSQGVVRHGPATTIQGGIETDLVQALRCQTWPLHYKQWKPTNRRRDWPTHEMIQHMKSTGCYVVRASHRLDERNETWRISTSLAERCLMFSLNITQIRCYVLIKMIVKTFIQPHLPDTISSYMCKTLMFHCIENTRKEFWKEHNLLQCVHQVLLYMIATVLDQNCPNYFNKAANLFFGKIGEGIKMVMRHILNSLLKSSGRFLLMINYDNINSRLSTYINGNNYILSQEQFTILKSSQARQMLCHFYSFIAALHVLVGRKLNVADFYDLVDLVKNYTEKGELQYKSARSLLPFLCSFVATTEATQCLRRNAPLKPSALQLFNLSLNSDVSSSRLKFASYLYCAGQLERTLSVLQDVEERMTDSVMMKCGCHDAIYPPGFLEREASRKYPTTDRLALSVVFSRAERPCCPRELQCEFYSSANEEKRRGVHRKSWTDLVVVDSLPYLYYLQYMTYRHLEQHVQQYMTLNKLSDCVRNNKYLTHRETAYNVLGQCMEYEGLLEDAIECYSRSLRIRPNNNAVRWHIMRLMGRGIERTVQGS